MICRLRRTSTFQVPPVLVAEAVAHSRVPDEDAARMASYVEAAAAAVEEETGIVLAESTFVYEARPPRSAVMRGSAVARVLLPRTPVASVDAVTVITAAGEVAALVAGDDYYAEDDGADYSVSFGLYGYVLSPGERLRITFTAGPTSPVPPLILQAICIMADDLYAERGSFVAGTIITPTPSAARVLAPLRRVTV